MTPVATTDRVSTYTQKVSANHRNELVTPVTNVFASNLRNAGGIVLSPAAAMGISLLSITHHDEGSGRNSSVRTHKARQIGVVRAEGRKTSCGWPLRRPGRVSMLGCGGKRGATVGSAGDPPRLACPRQEVGCRCLGRLGSGAPPHTPR